VVAWEIAVKALGGAAFPTTVYSVGKKVYWLYLLRLKPTAVNRSYSKGHYLNSSFTRLARVVGY